MEIEKIKNYNQKMLALFLTSLVAFAVVGLLSLIFFLLVEVFDFSQSSNTSTQEGIQFEDAPQNTDKGDPYKLQISYNFPDLVDTINQVYIISVGHQTVYQLESSLLKRGKYSSYDVSGSSHDYDYNSQPTFINLLVYDAKGPSLEKIFKQQVLIGQYNKYYYKDDVIIVFEAADKDSNKDGRITMEDETSLYFYSIRTKTVKQAKMEGQTMLQYEFIAKTKNAIIRFGQNPNTRKDQANIVLPGTLCQYDFDSDKLTTINNIQLDKELETIAIGKK